MGCVYGKPTAIQDSRESPREVQSVKAPSISREISSRRAESFRLPGRMASNKSERGNVNDQRANASSRFYDDHLEKKKKRGKSAQASIAGCPGAGSIPKALEAEQIAAGWPSWLAAVAGEAIMGWIPRRSDSFEKLDKIGQGTYSSVYRARDITNKKIVALKRVKFDNMDPESVKFMAREILILRRLDHPNVIKLEGLVTTRTSCHLYLVFEYMEHDLTGLASCPGIKFTVPQVKCYMHQLLSGLEHCHSRNILHRDIKGSNLLLDNSGILKIADFGLASFFNPDCSFAMTSRVVTLWYRPPELLLGSSHYGVAVDLWSTGCILGELCSGKPIMPGRTEVEQLHKIFKLCGSPSDDFWKKSKLRHSTVFRPQHPYRRRVTEAFRDLPSAAVKLIDTLLSVDPALRGSATSALQSEFFTTKPHACDPSSLPKYPPSKEIDAKLREEARRQGPSAGKGMIVDPEKRTRDPHATSAPNANAELVTSVQKRKCQPSAKSRSEQFNAQQDTASGLSKEPPNQAHDTKDLREHLHKKTAFSGPLVPGAGWLKAEKKLNDSPRISEDTSLSIFSELVATRLFSEDRQVKPVSSLSEATNKRGRHSGSLIEMDLMERQDKEHHRQPSEGSQKMQILKCQAKVPVMPGHVSERRNNFFSGPLLAPSDNVDQMLKDHERKIQEVTRRARKEKSKRRQWKAQAQGKQLMISPLPIANRGLN